MHTIQLLTGLVEQHQFLAYALIYIGLVFEGEITVISAGVLAHLGALNFWTALLFIFLGGLTKTFLGYAAGKYLFNKFNHNVFFRFIKRRVKYFLPGFKHHPFWSIFISKFIMGANNFVILYSGFERINYRKFLKAELWATVLWAPGLIILGYFFSYTALQVSREIWLFSTIVLVLFILYFIFDRMFSWLYGLFEEFHQNNQE